MPGHPPDFPTAPFPAELALDVGTCNTTVWAGGRGVVLAEPSLIAIHAVSGFGAVAVATPKEQPTVKVVCGKDSHVCEVSR